MHILIYNQEKWKEDLNLWKVFEEKNYIYWKQRNLKDVKVGDTVYIYETAPVKKIIMKCTIEECNISNQEFEDRGIVNALKNKENDYKGQWIKLVLNVDKLSYSNLQEIEPKFIPNFSMSFDDNSELAKYIDKLI